MSGILIGAIAGGLAGWIIQSLYEEKFDGGSEECKKCAYAHQQTGLNYIWLEPYYGKVLKIEYKEPAETGPWREYTDEIWRIHCKVINHEKNLVKNHMDAFVNPKTRFAKLRFTFNKNGIIYSREPDEQFYKLEHEYFQRFGICS